MKVIKQPYFGSEKIQDELRIGDKPCKEGYVSLWQTTPMSVTRGTLIIHKSVLRELALSLCPELEEEISHLKKENMMLNNAISSMKKRGSFDADSNSHSPSEF